MNFMEIVRREKGYHKRHIGLLRTGIETSKPNKFILVGFEIFNLF